MTRSAKPTVQPFIGFRVSPEVHAWLERAAREAGDHDADAAARRLIETIVEDDRRAEGEPPR